MVLVFPAAPLIRVSKDIDTTRSNIITLNIT